MISLGNWIVCAAMIGTPKISLVGIDCDCKMLMQSPSYASFGMKQYIGAGKVWAVGLSIWCLWSWVVELQTKEQKVGYAAPVIPG